MVMLRACVGIKIELLALQTTSDFKIATMEGNHRKMNIGH